MRSVYFSFHYADVWKANVVRNSGVVIGVRSAGFADGSLWEEAKLKSKKALERIIEDGLSGSSVTAVLIGRETADRDWVKYEVKRSIARGNALLGVYIDRIPDRNGKTARRGAVPYLLKKHGAPIHSWTTARAFGEQVEDAWQRKNNPSVWHTISDWFK